MMSCPLHGVRVSTIQSVECEKIHKIPPDKLLEQGDFFQVIPLNCSISIFIHYLYFEKRKFLGKKLECE